MKVHTYSLRAYAESRGLRLISALRELWRIKNGKPPTTDSDFIGISVDYEHWRRTNQLPRYATVALEHERLRQVEYQARASSQGFSSFQ